MTGFRARARAVDMLGRQQIANLPTALSELFKNSHDAYATKARADFFRPLNLLVVSDDGVGMDRETFEQAWLTIATESKLDRTPVPKPKGMRERVQLGEKGIGRFAIGALGSQVLVVSKRKGHPAIAALVSWKMFELPRIDLDDVPVGLSELDSDELTGEDIARLKAPLEEAVAGFRALDSTPQWSSRLDQILADLDAMPSDPFEDIPDLVPIDGSGTQFIIAPVSDVLPAEIENPNPKEAPLLDHTLHGFTDAWLPKSAKPDFSISFVDHRGGGDDQNLLESEDFFDAADFNHADHEIAGQFDDNGDFTGSIRIYDETLEDFVIKCPDSMQPRCGPFSFELGYVQGLASESRLDPEEYAEMSRKLRKLGGLYVYMDGIRVQPYGRPDFDYLAIEERRTLGASYYYFSYRRMFGAVRLSSDQNPDLQEKAGREGFTRGRAYTDFQRLLVNLFVELAARFFRGDAPQNQAYEKGRERLRREDSLRKQRDKQAAAGRKHLQAQLSTAVQFLDETDFQEQASEIVQDLSERLDDIDRLQPAAISVAEARRDLRELLEPLEFDEPEGFAPTGPMRQDMRHVERGLSDVESSYVRPALDAVDSLAAAVEARLAAQEADEKERRAFVEERIAAAREEFAGAYDEASLALTGLSEAVQNTLTGLRQEFDTEMAAFAAPNTSESSGWIQEQADFEQALESLAANTVRKLARVSNLVQANGLVFTAEAPTPDDFAAAADAEIVELRAQADAQLELVQLGMALAVVDHEFRATVNSIRSDVRRVGTWAKKNPQLVGLYEDLRRDFDHLDSYLSMLTPMQRRLRRKKTAIKGSDISRFLGELFYERLRHVGVEIRPSREFQAFALEGYTSTFYPVFINLVDNSLYWIEQSEPRPSRSIELSTKGDALVYKDSGPGIADDIAERVFDFGFTTKPGGSGLGLAIASQVLERAGWNISLGRCSDGAEFIIRPQRKKP
ncbi:ATP-binding protein [Candidatus Poriferisocius sp.]|uniref:ATP-binding protein n=1 Tax=Candidatus Poriferisocius sp. TaxID=3101276 RepID=UPI003B5B63D1